LFYIVRAELQTACELGEQLLSLAQCQHDPAHLLVAHQALGAALFHSGEFAASRQHSEQGIALYDPQQHHALTLVYGHNFGVVYGFYAAWTLWCLGALDASQHRSHEALTLAQELSHPYSLAWGLQHAARLHCCRREAHMVHERTEALMALCTQQGFAQYAATGTFLRGWVLAAQGHGEEGIAQMRQGLDVAQATGAGVNRPTFLAMLAEAYGQHGQVQEGLRVLIEAQAAVDKSGEHAYEAELYRLQGELLRHADGAMRMAEVTPE
jgi:predicted ATPase